MSSKLFPIFCPILVDQMYNNWNIFLSCILFLVTCIILNVSGTAIECSFSAGFLCPNPFLFVNVSPRFIDEHHRIASDFHSTHPTNRGSSRFISFQSGRSYNYIPPSLDLNPAGNSWRSAVLEWITDLCVSTQRRLAT